MNQIDPGPGYRIVHHSEPPQEGIEYLDDTGAWRKRKRQHLPLSQVWTYRIKVDPSQRYRITGTGSKCDGQIVEVVEWGEDHCLVGFQGAQTWIARRCLESITDHVVDANKKVDPTTKRSSDVDPGEGWRLLDKSEMPQKGDECLDIYGKWIESENWITGCRQANSPYRRRIEPEPVVKQSLTTEPEYIEPTMEHMGQMVEVTNNSQCWAKGSLLAVYDSSQGKRFVAKYSDGSVFLFVQARIKPETKPEPKYREVTPSDIGKKIEVRQSEKYGWIEKTLTKIIREQIWGERYRVEVRYHCQHNSAWRQARIVDGGEA